LDDEGDCTSSWRTVIEVVDSNQRQASMLINNNAQNFKCLPKVDVCAAAAAAAADVLHDAAAAANTGSARRRRRRRQNIGVRSASRSSCIEIQMISLM
jgi:hypothetical protein